MRTTRGRRRAGVGFSGGVVVAQIRPVENSARLRAGQILPSFAVDPTTGAVSVVWADGRFEPYPDQWAFLAGVARMDPARVEALAADAERHGGAIGLRWPDDEDAATCRHAIAHVPNA